MNWLKKHFPGIILSMIIAVVAVFLGNLFPIIGGAVFGIVIGILFSNFVGRSANAMPGIRFVSKKVLQWAIIILGGGLSFKQVFATGLSSFSVMVFTLSAAFISAYIFGKIFKIPFRMTSLIGMGTAICGGSAIAAISPIIEAEDREIAYSISVVFMFNVIAVLIFPPIGHLLGFSQHGFGLWAGTAINDTSSVVAAAYSYGNESGAYATIVKLTRTTMIIPISLIFAGVMLVRKRNQSLDSHVKFSFVKIFPWFIIGFIATSLLNTGGIISSHMAVYFTEAGKYMIVFALSAIGLGSDFRQMIQTGLRPMLLGLIVWVFVAVTSVVVQIFSGQM